MLTTFVKLPFKKDYNMINFNLRDFKRKKVDLYFCYNSFGPLNSILVL